MRVFSMTVVAMLAACSTVPSGSPSPSVTASPSPATALSPEVPLTADVVFHGGTVIAVDEAFTLATGLAVAGDRIVAVGDGNELVARAPDALHVDLEGRTLLPGIVDPHIHLEQNQSPDPERMLQEEEFLLESGRTTLGVPAIIPFNLEGFEAIRESGRALLRNHLYLSVNNSCGDVEEVEGWWRDFDFDRSADQRVAIAGIKLFMDGGSCNDPAFSFDWIDGTQGDLYVDAARVEDILRTADEEGALAVVHAIGDRGLDEALTGFEAALGGGNPNRHRIDHNTIVRDDQIARYGQVGANAVGWGWFNSCLERAGEGWASLGEEHLPWLRNYRDLRASSPRTTVAWHSDAPFTPVNIFEHLLGMTTFINIDPDTGASCAAPDWLAGHELTIEDALRMMTIDAATVMDLDADLGSLELGKIADLVILENNPLEQEGVELLDNRVVSTWISGRAGWCDGWSACDEVPGIRR